MKVLRPSCALKLILQNVKIDWNSKQVECCLDWNFTGCCHASINFVQNAQLYRYCPRLFSLPFCTKKCKQWLAPMHLSPQRCKHAWLLPCIYHHQGNWLPPCIYHHQGSQRCKQWLLPCIYHHQGSNSVSVIIISILILAIGLQSQLLADHLCISAVPQVITHSAPLSCYTDLHTTFPLTAPIHQPHLPSRGTVVAAASWGGGGGGECVWK